MRKPCYWVSNCVPNATPLLAYPNAADLSCSALILTTAVLHFPRSHSVIKPPLLPRLLPLSVVANCSITLHFLKLLSDDTLPAPVSSKYRVFSTEVCDLGRIFCII